MITNFLAQFFNLNRGMLLEKYINPEIRIKSRYNGKLKSDWKNLTPQRIENELKIISIILNIGTMRGKDDNPQRIENKLKITSIILNIGTMRGKDDNPGSLENKP